MLRVEPGELDAEVFERLVREAAGAPSERFARSASEPRWRSGAARHSTDLAYDGFAEAAIKRTRRRERHGVRGARGRPSSQLGRHAEAAVELEALVAEYPWRERLRGQLMLALYRSGRQAEALEVYRDGADAASRGARPRARATSLRAARAGDPDAGRSARGRRPVAPAEREPAADGAERSSRCSSPTSPARRGLRRSVDPETLRTVMASLLRARCARWPNATSGTLEKFSGDEVMVVFGVPTAARGRRAPRRARRRRDARRARPS